MDIVHGELQLAQPFNAHGFIESQIGLVGHTMVDGGVDNGAVELKHTVLCIAQMFRHLGRIGVEADTKKRAALVDEVD